MEKRRQGFTDEAAQEDLFEIKKYINGLASFIEDCNTPMTISIQGTWGTGKTSIMQMVNNILTANGNTKNIWFNTWKFSQFNMENEIAVSLLSDLLYGLSVSDSQKEKASKITQAIRLAQNIGKIGKDVLLSMLEVSAGSKITERVEQGINKVQETVMGQVDPHSAIKDLNEQFSKCVEETLELTNKEKVVVFIDDLDRLEPRKAIELLEVLKLFLDCKNCVFVLAIDYEVVCRGVEAKYGRLSDDERGNREKGKSFFDKIIQVPFKMPIAEYNIRNYVINCFDEIGINCSNIDDYIELIKLSIGTNPRSMKRLFNIYLLLTIVVSEEVLEYDKNKNLLFAVLCLQHSFEKTYNYIVARKDDITADDLRNLTGSGIQEMELNEEEAERLLPFMEKFIQTIDVDKNGTISEQEMDNLRNVLGISTISSSGSDIVSVRKGVVEVSTVGELELGEKDPAKLESLIEKIKTVGEGVTCSIRNNKTPHVLFKNKNGNSFADIYMRKTGFSIDCLPCSMKIADSPEMSAIFEQYGNVAKKNGRYITFKLMDADIKAEKAFLMMAKICHDSYGE